MRVFRNRLRTFGRVWSFFRPVRRGPVLNDPAFDRWLSIGLDGQLYRMVAGTWVNVSLLGER
jgi:hypothetical protein